MEAPLVSRKKMTDRWLDQETTKERVRVEACLVKKKELVMQEPRMHKSEPPG